MKLWIGGIVDEVIANDFRLMRNHVEAIINSRIELTNYGGGLSTWDVILVISSTPPEGYVKYAKSSGESDVRIVIEYNIFIAHNQSDRFGMICLSLIESIDKLSKKNISGFDFKKLKYDVMDVIKINKF